MRCLSPAGISIPCSYTSFLAPVSSNKLHSEIANSSDPKYPEQPYVVMFQAAQILSEAGGRENYPKYAECWGFDHPRHDIVCDSLGERSAPHGLDNRFTD
jgi:protein arginine N-methyltransferase 5